MTNRTPSGAVVHARCRGCLCGHATLARGYWLWHSAPFRRVCCRVRNPQRAAYRERDGDNVVLEFPAGPAAQVPASADLLTTLRGTVPVWTGVTRNDDPGERNLLAVLESEELIRSHAPDLEAIARLPAGGLIVTARSPTGGVVSRYFALPTGYRRTRSQDRLSSLSLPTGATSSAPPCSPSRRPRAGEHCRSRRKPDECSCPARHARPSPGSSTGPVWLVANA